MTSVVDVMNRGLSKLGTDRVVSRLDDNKRAREMDACYDSLRDAELCANRWRFSLKRASLTALSSAPIGTQFTLEYQLPTDCLQLVQVGEFYVPSLTDYRLSDEAPFSVEGRKILTNFPAPLFIRYVSQVTDPNQFDACFIESLGAMLGQQTCEALTGSSTKKDDLMKDYAFWIDRAITANAIETPPQAVADDAWIVARIS